MDREREREGEYFKLIPKELRKPTQGRDSQYLTRGVSITLTSHRPYLRSQPFKFPLF